MTALGMTALHLRIADFKFTHTFIICNRLPDTEILFGIDIQKKNSFSYAWDKEKNCYIQKDSSFSLMLEPVNRRQQYELSSQCSKYLLDIMALSQLKSKDTELKVIQQILSAMKIQQKERVQTSTT